MTATRLRWGTALAWLLCALAWPARAEITASIEARSDTLYLGESVTVLVRVRGSDVIDLPDFSAATNCEVRFVGSQAVNFTSTEWTYGGAPRVHREIGKDFNFEVTPRESGTVTIGPVIVRAGGDARQIEGPRVTVTGAQQQDRVLLAVASSRDTVLVDEAFEIEVILAIRALDAPYAEHDPLNPQSPPKLVVPFLDGPGIEGLQGPDIQPLLQGLTVSDRAAPAFHLNGFMFRNDPFGSLFSMGSPFEQAARFMFPRQMAVTTNGTYQEYRLRVTYTAKREGDYTFGPVEFKGPVIAAVGAGGRIAARDIFATAPACIVHVVPPPQEGRPATFIGAVGSNLNVRATLDAQTCNAGDPLTLSLDLSGDINVDNLHPPVLAKQEGLEPRFRVYEDTVRSDSRPDGKTYRYTVRPLEAGTYEFPPLAVSYYDVNARDYRTVLTAPIPMRVNESAQVGGDIIVSAATNRLGQSVAFTSATGAALIPITMDASGASTRSWFAWRLHGSLAAAGPLVLGLTLAARGWRRLARKHAQQRRPRLARHHAERILLRAERHPARQGAAVRTALAGYLEDRLGGPPAAGLSPRDVERLLSAHPEVPPELAARVADCYREAFNLEFLPHATAPAAADHDGIGTVRALLHELDRATSRGASAHAQTAARMLIVAAAAWLTAASGHAATEVEQAFLWDQANARMMAAAAPADFQEAAARYTDLVQSGARNGPLFYNQGVAFLKAGRYEAATRAFLRAERYMGSTAATLQGLRLAHAQGKADAAMELPWYRVPLFWHYRLDAPTRLAAALLAFFLWWLSLALRCTHRADDLARHLHVISVVLLVLFGSSAGASWHAEQVDRRRDLSTATTTSPPPTGQAGVIP
jgi:hypothetical protein